MIVKLGPSQVPAAKAIDGLLTALDLFKTTFSTTHPVIVFPVLTRQ